MPVVILMRWPGVTPDQYAQAMETLDLDANPPEGGIFHVAGFESDSIRVLDVWESPGHFQAFLQERLAPATEAAGMTGEPEVLIYDVHNTWTPDRASLERLTGAVS